MDYEFRSSKGQNFRSVQFLNTIQPDGEGGVTSYCGIGILEGGEVVEVVYQTVAAYKGDPDIQGMKRLLWRRLEVRKP